MLIVIYHDDSTQLFALCLRSNRLRDLAIVDIPLPVQHSAEMTVTLTPATISLVSSTMVADFSMVTAKVTVGIRHFFFYLRIIR